jgi:uncharacterized protein (DUF302 family)
MKYSKTLGSVALSTLLLLGMTGCSDNDTIVAEAPVVEAPVVEAPVEVVETISPYQRVAVISGGWDKVNAIADKIAQYVTLTDEDAVLGFESKGWLIGGAKTANNGGGETYEFTDLLPIPAMGVTDNTGKSRVIEFCNGKYASMAMGTGLRHGPALPCEVSVHSDGTNVYIDMLDADAIFSIFFHDITDDGTLKQIAADVKYELRTMVLAALNDSTIVAANDPVVDPSITAEAPKLTAAVEHTESTEALGPKFSASDISDSVSYRDPYIVYKYTGNRVFEQADAKALAADIIAAMNHGSVDAGANGGFLTAEDTDGLEGLSVGSLWRSGRPDPLGIPGVFIAEACSPKYASKATTLGNEYITALPCEISVYVDDTADDYDASAGITKATGSTLSISFLNPNFMFGTMFEGAVANALTNGTIDKPGAIEYSTLADVVFGDLRMIVDHAVQGSTLDLTISK